MPAHNGRRRRMLNEELLAPIPPSNSRRPMDTTSASRYTDAANIENHPQVSDLIGRRFRSYAVVVAAGGLWIAALLAADSYASRIAQRVGRDAVASLELAERGSLAAWTTSLGLAAMAPLCLLIYSLRRHRIDDYHARYRVWMWVAGGCLAASCSVVTRLHEAFAKWMVALTGWSPFAFETFWWLAPAVVAGIWIGSRLAMELRECRTAISVYAGGCTLLLLAVTTAQGWVQVPAEDLAATIAWGSGMAAVLAFAVTFNAFARFVVLDVQGLIEHRTGKRVAPRIAGGDEDAAAPASQLALHQEPATTEPPATEWVDGSRPCDGEDNGEGRSSRRKANKAERKKSRRRSVRRAA